MKVFLDANVLFSAANPGSPVAKLTAALFSGETVTSALAVQEARRNLDEKRPAWMPHFDALLDGVELVPEADLQLEIDLVEKDRPILDAAVQAECTHLVTSDRRHFGHLYGRSIRGVKVVSLVGLAEDLVRAGRI